MQPRNPQHDHHRVWGRTSEQANNMVLVRTGNIAEVNVTVPTLFFFHTHCTGLHHNKGGNIHDRTVPTQMSLHASGV